jgi:dTDP-4-dehydrorhamnose 3,5-epimerase
MDLISTFLGCVKLFAPKVFDDERGFFFESYSKRVLEGFGIVESFVQDNHSMSTKNVLRGMHFQKGQAKLVRCPVGQVFDVFVDLRKDSPTYKQWAFVILDGDRQNILYIPDGFAHGFFVLSNRAHLTYKVSTFYDGQLESSFRFDDPSIGIGWPEGEKILSQRDASAPFFDEVIR